MPLLETFVTGIAAAVAKGVLKMWMKDDPLVLTASTTTADLLKSKLTSVLDQRAANRQLEKITERSATSFEQMMEKDDTKLSESDVQFIANAAAAVINNTDLTPELLAENDLDPEDLAKYFLSRTGAQGGNPELANSEDSERRDLYGRFLLSASQQIVDISSRLPLFTERIFREMLQRENRIYDVAEKVLNGVDQLLARQKGEDPAAERYETNYRLACVRKYDHLQLFGVDLDQSNQRYKLNVAYVTLEVEKTTIEDVDEDASSKNLDEEGDADFREAMPVDQALSKANRLLVRGLAGAGKTTLVQWAAVYCAAKQHTGDLESCNDLVPFVIKLRDLENGKLPKPKEFAEVVAPHTGGEPVGWSHRMLEHGKAIVLIDGLDEAAEEQRKEVRDWLKALITQYPESRYIVTTRPFAVDEGWLDDDGFVDATLQDMTPRDVTRFVEHWHRAVASGLDKEEDKAALPKLASSLTDQLKRNSDLANLATSPLLCAMICALHRDRNQVLPKNRIGLYRACIDMFFRRDNERNVRMDDYVEIADDDKLLLLRSLAWWLIRNGKSSATVDETHQRLEHALSELNPPPPDVNGEMVTRLFIHRVAMLQQFATGKINFPHRTFQEFLAAQEALAEGDQQLLIDNAEKEQWREVAIVAAGLIENKEAAEKFVHGLLVRGDNEKEHQQPLYLIGAAARQNVSRLTEESKLETEARRRLGKILPPKSMKSAQALAKAGNLVIPLLAYNRKQAAPATSASARTLALINTGESVQMLIDYLADDRFTVWKSLHVSAQYLSDEFREQFGTQAAPLEFKRLLPKGQPSKVTLSGLRFSTKCPPLHASLQTLDLSYCGSLSDVSALGTVNPCNRSTWIPAVR